MIITKEILVKTTSLTYTDYKKLGYEVNSNEIILVKIEHLSLGSHLKVDIKCDECSNVYKYEYRGISHFLYKKYKSKKCKHEKSLIRKENIKNKKKEFKIFKETEEYRKQKINKIRSEKLIKYGNETYNNQDKRKETMFKRYGKYFPNPAKKNRHHY